MADKNGNIDEHTVKLELSIPTVAEAKAANKRRRQEDLDGPQEFPLPAGYEKESVGFARAYAHAKRHGNPDKSALLYAQAWAFDFEETGEDDDV